MDYFGTKLHIKNKHFFWENNRLFFLLADTIWYGLTQRVTEDDFEKILLDRKKKGFTAIQVVIGTPPESEIWNENAKSTHQKYVYNKDFTINLEYFDDIQKKIEMIVKHKLVPILYGSWGQYIDVVDVSGMCDMWKHIVSRFSKYPVIFCLCGEADIFTFQTINPGILQRVFSHFYFAKRFVKSFVEMNRKSYLKNRIRKWQTVANFLREENKENHPLTVHIQSKEIASEIFTNPNFIDIDSFQSGHSSSGINLMNGNFSKLHLSNRPYVNLEPLYEGILNQYDPRLQTYAFWNSIFSGAIGHVYGAHGLWQLAAGDQFMSHWGKSSWRKALDYPGSTILGNAKKYIQESRWELFSKENINISYITKPTLPHIAGRIENTIYLYIPEPYLVHDIELKHSFQVVDSFDPATFDKLPMNNFNNLKKVKSQYKDIFYTIKIV